jgi:hypothetical protein
MNHTLTFTILFLALVLNFAGLFPLFAATVDSDKIEVGSSTANRAEADSSHQSEASGNSAGSSSETVQLSPNSTSSATDAFHLPEVTVYGRADSLLGIADAASQGAVGKEVLEYRTLSRPGEVLETVPGVIATQHSGADKANQFFLRGFNLDHGTDFATSVNGVPVNLPTHGHGQGYSDLNFMIPELIGRVDFRKGVYYADLGDFSSAGAANIQYADSLPQSIAQVEGGSFGYERGLYASSHHIGSGNLLNNRDHDIDYYYPSRLESEAAWPDGGGYNDIHFKSVEPIAVRAALTFRF